ncbi:hypothetical protein RFI_16234, partial [Reticulomyxa filosa]
MKLPVVASSFYWVLFVCCHGYNNGKGLFPAMVTFVQGKGDLLKKVQKKHNKIKKGMEYVVQLIRTFKKKKNEKEVMEVAMAMKSNGMYAAGYKHLNLDDCWEGETRNLQTGQIRPDVNRFPNGIEYLTNWLHNEGYEFGLYTSAGIKKKKK